MSKQANGPATDTVTGLSDKYQCGSCFFLERALPAHAKWESVGMFPLMEQFGFHGMLMVSSHLGLKFVFSKLD